MSLLTNLVAAFELNEASGNALDSFGTNTLTNNNAVGSTTGIVYGTVRQFINASSQYFSITDNTDLSVSGSFTIELWVYFDTLVDGRAVMGKGGRPEYLFYVTGGKLEFILLDSATYVSRQTAALSTGTWYQVIAWIDSGVEIGIAVNGGAASTTAIASSPFDGVGDFNIGTAPGFGFHDGRIGPVRMWNGRVLTSGERISLYNGGAGLPYASFGGGGSDTLMAQCCF